MKIGKKLKKIINQITNTDLRLKLKFLKKKTNINFYPDNFSKTGLKSIYTRLIFFLLMMERFYKEIRIKYRMIFNTKFEYDKIKIINIIPRSGSTFLMNLIYSERELFNGSGDGVPKYKSEVDEFVFNVLENKRRIPFQLFEICYLDLTFHDYRNYNQDVRAYDYNNFYFSGYPTPKNDLIPHQEKLRQIYLVREPISQCISYLKHMLNFDKFVTLENKNFENEYIFKKLKIVCENYKSFINHVYEKRYQENIMIITYESLVNDTKLTLKKIYNFFQVEFNEQFLEKSININSKQNTLKMLYKNKKVSNRISNYQFEKDFEVTLIKRIKESLKYELIKYDEFIR